MSQTINDHLVLISGSSATGKSASLMNIKNPEGVAYLNCEAGKKLPFRSKFKELKITDPMVVYEAFRQAETDDSIHTIVIDTLTFLMEMYESMYVLTASNTMKAWSDYAQYFKNLMQQYVARSTKNVIILAHTSRELNEELMDMESFVKIKGSIMKTGVESFFSTVVSTKKVPITKLDAYGSDLLTITPEDEALGYKYVYQTKLTKDTTGERIRAPIGMWDTKETFIDNDAQKIIERLFEYYQ
jgi:hypothetical protein